MKNYRNSVLWLIAAFLLSAMAVGQEDAPDQLKDGESGYKVGCSAAASLGIPACGELPSGRQFLGDQDSANEDNASSAQESSPDQDASQEANIDDEEPTQPSNTEQFQQVMQSVINVLQNRPWENTATKPYVPAPRRASEKRNGGYNRNDDCPPNAQSCR